MYTKRLTETEIDTDVKVKKNGCGGKKEYTNIIIYKEREIDIDPKIIIQKKI